MEAGLDSLASVEFRNRLQQQLGDAMAVPDTLVFDFPTIRQMEKHIESTGRAPPHQRSRSRKPSRSLLRRVWLRRGASYQPSDG